jgi:ADP-heptose:LPS heptosyltransferase
VALGINTAGCYANLPVLAKAQTSIEKKLRAEHITSPYFVMNPAGGSNPGMLMDSKRYPPEKLAQLAHAVAQALNLKLVIVTGPDDKPLVDAMQQHLKIPSVVFLGNLTFAEIGALAAGAQFYIGNDTGLTHLAAASGAKTIALFGPSDPLRYVPYTPQSLALWQPAKIKAGGVAASGEQAWDWQKDGMSVEEVIQKTLEFVQTVGEKTK